MCYINIRSLFITVVVIVLFELLIIGRDRLVTNTALSTPMQLSSITGVNATSALKEYDIGTDTNFSIARCAKAVHIHILGQGSDNTGDIITVATGAGAIWDNYNYVQVKTVVAATNLYASGWIPLSVTCGLTTRVTKVSSTLVSIGNVTGATF